MRSKPGRGGRGEDTALVLEREQRAVSLKLAGLTYEQIANTIGVTDKSQAQRIVLRALGRRHAESVDSLRTIEGDRLDRLQAAVWQQALQGNLRAVETALRISERRSRLFGLDHSDKIAERQVEIAEQQALMALSVIDKALTALGVDPTSPEVAKVLHDQFANVIDGEVVEPAALPAGDQ